VSMLNFQNSINLNKEKDIHFLKFSSEKNTAHNNQVTNNNEHSPNMTINDIKDSSYFRNNLTETDTVKKTRSQKHMASVLSRSTNSNLYRKLEVPLKNSTQVSIDNNQNTQSQIYNRSSATINLTTGTLNRSKSRIRINTYNSKETNIQNSSPNLNFSTATNKAMQYKKIRNISLIQMNNSSTNPVKNNILNSTTTNMKRLMNTSKPNLRDNSINSSSVVRDKSRNPSVETKKFIFKAKYTKKIELEKTEKHMINKFMDKMLNLNLSKTVNNANNK
jgi:hypothetical protein